MVYTDITHAFLLVTVAGLLHISYKNVNYMLVRNLPIGFIPRLLIGSSISAKVRTSPLLTVVAKVTVMYASNSGEVKPLDPDTTPKYMKYYLIDLVK